MTKRLVIVGTVLLVVAMVALAADAVSGKWTYEQPGRGGGNPTQVTLELKADGAKLTGTILQPMGGRGMGGGGGAPGGGAPPAPQPAPISNGKVDGNNISFEVTREIMGNSMTTKYEGTVSGSEMKMKMTFPGFNGGEPMTIDGVAKKS